MNDVVILSDDPERPVEINLRNPALAALWAWLWPGAGHIYQGRMAKGLLFMVCILTTYFFGFAIGGGRVVYASFKKPDIRYPFICQAGVGLPAAIPAMIQNVRVQRMEKEPLFGGYMAPPRNVDLQNNDELASWHRELRGRFELGTLYTMVAGLLNMLAIFDAYGGPVFMPPNEKKKRAPPEDEDKESSSD